MDAEVQVVFCSWLRTYMEACWGGVLDDHDFGLREGAIPGFIRLLCVKWNAITGSRLPPDRPYRPGLAPWNWLLSIWSNGNQVEIRLQSIGVTLRWSLS